MCGRVLLGIQQTEDAVRPFFDYRMLAQQRYNHLKPEKKIREGETPADRRALAREWLKFAIQAVSYDRKAELIGKRQGRLAPSEKLKRQAELVTLLKRRTEGKTTKEDESRLRWLLEGCSLNSLTKIIRTVGYEEFKTNIGSSPLI